MNVDVLRIELPEFVEEEEEEEGLERRAWRRIFHLSDEAFSFVLFSIFWFQCLGETERKELREHVGLVYIWFHFGGTKIIFYSCGTFVED